MPNLGRRAEDALPHGPNATFISDAVATCDLNGEFTGSSSRLSLPDTAWPLINDHFPYPARRVLMGVLGIEALMQTGAAGALELPIFAGKLLVPVAASGRFRKAIRPDEEVDLVIDELKIIGNKGGRASGRVMVDGETRTSASFSFVAANLEEFGKD